MIAAAAILALAAAAPAPAPAADAHPLSARAEVSAAAVKLGEPFTLTVEVHHRPEETYLLPRTPALAPFQALGAGGCRRADRSAGEVVTLCTLPLGLYALGEHEVPALVLDAQTPAGPAVLAVAGPRVKAVALLDPAVPAQGVPLRPPAPPVPLLVRSFLPALWAAGALAAAVALVLLVRRLARPRPAPAPPGPPPSPGERFARRLDALVGERLPSRGRGEEHVARLSELVREYLGALTGLHALDLTTGELLDALGAVGDPRLDLAALERFLSVADLVKFARAEAHAATCEAAVAYARALLAATWVPAPARAAGGG